LGVFVLLAVNGFEVLPVAGNLRRRRNWARGHPAWDVVQRDDPTEKHQRTDCKNLLFLVQSNFCWFFCVYCIVYDIKRITKVKDKFRKRDRVLISCYAKLRKRLKTLRRSESGG